VPDQRSKRAFAAFSVNHKLGRPSCALVDYIA